MKGLLGFEKYSERLRKQGAGLLKVGRFPLLDREFDGDKLKVEIQLNDLKRDVEVHFFLKKSEKKAKVFKIEHIPSSRKNRD